MNIYIAFFNGKETQLEAETLYDAKRLAIAFFKPRGKKQEYMVHVHLAKLASESKPVTHVAVD